MKKLKVFMVGDIHGHWGDLNTLINRRKPDIIIQLGDFGWWPHYHMKTGMYRDKKKKFNQFNIKNFQNGKLTKILWLPGNHENWDDLKCITNYAPLEIQDGVTYCPFGTVIEVNGFNILMVGGAESYDKLSRTEGDSWWKNELIDQEDMDNLPDCNIDIVCSHTIPRDWLNNCGWGEKMKDSSTFALQLIREKYQPKKWFSAHFHKYLKCDIQGCEWTSLACPDDQETWWVEL